jgi:hypothetical protein
MRFENGMTKAIILLDVDGVLVRAGAYRAAAKVAVEHVAHRMGQPHINGPDDSEMLAFEARSIISEWDSVALCAAELLNQAPDLLGDTLDSSIKNIVDSGRLLDQPDFAALARRCPSPTHEIQPGPAALGTVFPRTAPFAQLLGETHLIHAPMTQIFQHFTLGHSLFEQTYGLPMQFEAASLLETHDTPMLSAQSRDMLLTRADVFPTLYTARPGLAPEFVADQIGYSPEAEMAQKQVGLDAIPVVGYGKMRWLALQDQRHDSDYLKPSPMHASVAIFSALLYSESDWERRAFDIAIRTEGIPQNLKDEPWHVIVCEDSTGGIRGVRGAVEQLQAHHDITLTAVGIAQHADNIAALQQVADVIAPDVNAGLALVLG